jgi:hypothetical protein
MRSPCGEATGGNQSGAVVGTVRNATASSPTCPGNNPPGTVIRAAARLIDVP